MEEDFLDLGLIDPNILEDVPEVKEETTEKKEDIDNSEKNETVIEEKTEEHETKAEKKEVENSTSTETGSPNISSSIAQALVDSGVLQTLNAEQIAGITDAESLIAAQEEEINNRVDSQLTDIQKRVNNALNYGVEPTKIQQYEQWINTLDQVTDTILEGEGEQSENYRKNLIYNNYIVKGFDKEDALEMTNRSIESGKDIDDAKKALSSLKKYYQKSYEDEVADAKKQYDIHIENQKKQLKDLKDSILDDKEGFYEQFEINKSIRQKIFDSVAKASITDGDKKLTPLQKFIKDDPNKANKIIGTLYVITDGFTDFKGLMKGEVKKQVRDSVKNLERVLHQSNISDGSMNFKTGLTNELPNTKILDFDLED